MPFLPFETLVIETSLSKEEVATNLANNIEPEKTIRFWIKPDRKAFEGHLRNDEFKITRIISYRNSFLPVIKGKLQTVGHSTHIALTMRLHVATIAFITVWFSGVALFLAIDLFSKHSHKEVLGIPFGLLLFGYALTMGCYLFESYRAKQILTEITKGKIIEKRHYYVYCFHGKSLTLNRVSEAGNSGEAFIHHQSLFMYTNGISTIPDGLKTR